MSKIVRWLERRFIYVLQITILWCIITSAIPLLYFWFRTDQVTWMDHLYFIFASGRDILLLLALFLIINKPYRVLIWPYLLYLTIVFVWQIIASLTGWDVNHPKMVITLFSALLTGVIILLRKDLIHRSKE